VSRRWLLGLDVATVLLFVAIGRDTHDRDNTALGLVETAAPFLIAVALGWLVTRAWRSPASLPVGVGVWVTTVAGGMVLRRAVFGDGTAVAFVLVATAFLGVFILGWRFASARLG
jgi:hypothetical protein